MKYHGALTVLSAVARTLIDTSVFFSNNDRWRWKRKIVQAWKQYESDIFLNYVWPPCKKTVFLESCLAQQQRGLREKEEGDFLLFRPRKSIVIRDSDFCFLLSGLPFLSLSAQLLSCF